MYIFYKKIYICINIYTIYNNIYWLDIGNLQIKYCTIFYFIFIEIVILVIRPIKVKFFVKRDHRVTVCWISDCIKSAVNNDCNP